MQDPFVSLARRIWRMAVPFWLFRDASIGSALERHASYRYNRQRRHLLPFFLFKWLGLAFCLLQAMLPLAQIMAALDYGSAGYWIVLGLNLLNGIAFAFACVVFTVLLASYLYLCGVEE